MFVRRACSRSFLGSSIMLPDQIPRSRGQKTRLQTDRKPPIIKRIFLLNYINTLKRCQYFKATLLDSDKYLVNSEKSNKSHLSEYPNNFHPLMYIIVYVSSPLLGVYKQKIKLEEYMNDTRVIYTSFCENQSPIKHS